MRNSYQELQSFLPKNGLEYFVSNLLYKFSNINSLIKKMLCRMANSEGLLQEHYIQVLHCLGLLPGDYCSKFYNISQVL